MTYSEEDLLKIPGLGKNAVNNIRLEFKRFTTWVVACVDPQDGKWKTVRRCSTKKEGFNTAKEYIEKGINAVVAPCYEGLYIWKG